MGINRIIKSIMKYILKILLFLIICDACKRSDIDVFDIVEEITDYDSVYSDKNDVFNRITDMAILDSVLITKHMNDTYHFSFIDVNGKKIIKRLGKRGRGPGEYLQIGTGFTVCGSKLVFLDAMQKEINYVSISDVIENKIPYHIEKEAYPYTVDFRPRHMEVINHVKVALGSFKEGYFGLLDSSNNILGCFFDYPFAYEGVEGIYRGSVYQTKISSNDIQNKFVILTLASDVFEIYQIEGKDIHRIFLNPYNHIPLIRERAGRYGIRINESIAGLMKMAVSDEMICFTYSAESYAKANKAGFISNEILCFNWKGEKIKKYLLPFPISTFCVDKHFIYGVRYIDDESIIYRFKL